MFSADIPPTVKAVLFDAAGTLIHPVPSAPEAYYAIGRQYGTRLDLPEVATRFRAAFRTSEELESQAGNPVRIDEASERRRWRRIVGQVFDDVQQCDVLFEELWRHFADPRHWALYDDVPAALHSLRQRGLLLGVASNFDGRLHAICDAFTPLANCSRRFVSSEIGWRKPCREFFVAIERALGLAPEQLLLVGDDERNDYRGAQSAGWHAMLVDRRA